MINTTGKTLSISLSTGLRTLLGLIFSGLFLYQSIILLDNYNSKDTFRTVKEVDMKGPMPMPSPLVIICQDPGSLNISDLTVSQAPYSWTNFTVNTMETLFKVIQIALIGRLPHIQC